MAAIDKLIDLLEQIKQTDPDFTEKASNAIDALIGEGEENKVRKPPPRRKRSRKHGFRSRMRSRNGRNILKRKRRKGRKTISI